MCIISTWSRSCITHMSSGSEHLQMSYLIYVWFLTFLQAYNQTLEVAWLHINIFILFAHTAKIKYKMKRSCASIYPFACFIFITAQWISLKFDVSSLNWMSSKFHLICVCPLNPLLHIKFKWTLTKFSIHDSSYKI